MERDRPEWLIQSDEAFDPTHKRMAKALQNHDLPVQLANTPLQALWFFVSSMGLAYDANKEGMHANALSLTRQCIETLSLVELGISRHAGRETILKRWEDGKVSPGQLRQWLAKNLWPTYGSGIWQEDWETFMGHLARAVQPYAHYTPQLAQWQSRIHFMNPSDRTALIELGPKAYDPQKATRITLYHAILNYTLARVWLARFGKDDPDFSAQINRLGRAIGKSRYLDGNSTNWEQQFWAMVFKKDGSTILE